MAMPWEDGRMRGRVVELHDSNTKEAPFQRLADTGLTVSA